MLAALPSCRAEMSSTPASTSAWETLKLAVPRRPKQRRAPYLTRSPATTCATVGVPVMRSSFPDFDAKGQVIQGHITRRASGRKGDGRHDFRVKLQAQKHGH